MLVFSYSLRIKRAIVLVLVSAPNCDENQSTMNIHFHQETTFTKYTYCGFCIYALQLQKKRKKSTNNRSLIIATFWLSFSHFKMSYIKRNIISFSLVIVIQINFSIAPLRFQKSQLYLILLLCICNTHALFLRGPCTVRHWIMISPLKFIRSALRIIFIFLRRCLSLHKD